MNSEERIENEQKHKAFYKKKYKAYLQECLTMRKYSINRIDIIVIALSSGGIVLLLNLLKELQTGCPLKIAWMKVLVLWAIAAYGLSIITNIISQYIAYRDTSTEASQMTQALMRLEGLQKKEIEKDFLKNSENVIEGLNIASIVLLIIGFVLTFLTLL